jgi:hypothetical protein
MPFHQRGHAIIMWFAGIFAVPLPFYTYWSSDRNVALFILFHLVWASGIRPALRSHSKVLLALFSCLLVLQSLFLFFMPIEKLREIGFPFGHGGKIVMGTPLVSSLTWKLPRQMRWDFWRFPIRLAGGILFASKAVQWFQIKYGIRPIPRASAVDKDTYGDLAKLRALYG